MRVSGISGCMPSTHLSPISRCANSTVSSIARRAAARSMSTSRPSRFTTRPLTITVWTSARCAWKATWPYGCSTGNMTGECSFLTSTTSAFLPSASDLISPQVVVGDRLLLGVRLEVLARAVGAQRRAHGAEQVAAPPHARVHRERDRDVVLAQLPRRWVALAGALLALGRD